jgi:hypothetical protein
VDRPPRGVPVRPARGGEGAARSRSRPEPAAPPERLHATILRDTKAWRDRITQYWFWGNGSLLSKEAAQRAVRIADTIGGDELVFLPTEPDTLLLLPHEDEEVQLVSTTGLLAALTRLVTSESGRVPARLTYEPTSDGEKK